MCGICGVAGFEDRGLVGRMSELLRPRGPDSGGLFQDRGVVLGVRRLRVIDLRTGDQPLSNEDATLHVIQNGEIYNYRELRAELEGEGHTFQSSTDTEVLVHLYEEEGVKFVERLRGMFAVALWDGPRRRLLLARDRLGIKPLYYALRDGQLLFASELKALLAHEELPRELSPEGLAGYLALRYVPGPWTILASVRKLPPGTLLLWEGGRAEVRRYWDLRWTEGGMDEARAVEGVRSRLEDAVASHLVSDVPLGVFLSGGIDSSAVAALASRRLGGRLQTFSVGFDLPDYDESPHAREVADHLGTEHHELRLDDSCGRRIPEMLWHLDEPLADAAALPTYLLAEFARRRITVALTGEGADEVFAGYDYYRPLAGTPGFLGGSGEQRYARTVRVFPPRALRSLVARPVPALDPFAPYRIRGPPLHRVLHLETKVWLPDDLLMKVDKTTMAHSLEARVPYLDHPLVEFAAQLPPRLKVQGGVGKAILRRAVGPLLPPATVDRRKQGFVVPTPLWARGDLGDRIAQVLSGASSGIFRRRAMEEFSRRVREPRYKHQVWTLFALELWHRMFVDSDGTQPRNFEAFLG